MTQAAVRQYINGATVKQLDVLEKYIVAARERAEIDAAIKKALASKINYTPKEVDEHLRKHFEKYKQKKDHAKVPA